MISKCISAPYIDDPFLTQLFCDFLYIEELGEAPKLNMTAKQGGASNVQIKLKHVILDRHTDMPLSVMVCHHAH